MGDSPSKCIKQFEAHLDNANNVAFATSIDSDHCVNLPNLLYMRKFMDPQPYSEHTAKTL